jgi:hypothetical protein
VSNWNDPCPKLDGKPHQWAGLVTAKIVTCQLCGAEHEPPPLTPEEVAQAGRIIEALVAGAETLGPNEQIAVDTKTGETTFAKLPTKPS